MIRLVQIVPQNGVRLFGEMVKKEIELNRNKRGTFYRSGPKHRDRTKWSHVKHNGWVNLERGAGEVVSVEVQSRSQAEDEWQLLHALIGWVDRHFSDKVLAINIQYRE